MLLPGATCGVEARDVLALHQVSVGNLSFQQIVVDLHLGQRFELPFEIAGESDRHRLLDPSAKIGFVSRVLLVCGRHHPSYSVAEHVATSKSIEINFMNYFK